MTKRQRDRETERHRDTETKEERHRDTETKEERHIDRIGEGRCMYEKSEKQIDENTKERETKRWTD